MRYSKDEIELNIKRAVNSAISKVGITMALVSIAKILYNKFEAEPNWTMSKANENECPECKKYHDKSHRT